MGRAWDNAGVSFQPETWAHALRVLKPGGHLLAFGGTRTYHRIAVAIEDAGFEIRDCLSWMYGSGFPKSLDVSKAIDARAGAEREVVGSKLGRPGYSLADGPDNSIYGRGIGGSGDPEREAEITAPATEGAAAWTGWGTALKPAFEPIVLARKPLDEGTVAANVLAHGVGALNIDDCRVAAPEGASPAATRRAGSSAHLEGQHGVPGAATAAQAEGRIRTRTAPDVYAAPRAGEQDGRWPANVLLSHHHDCVELGPVEVRGTGHTPSSRPSSAFAANAQAEEVERSWRREVVTAHDCHPDCPVGILDGQSGTLSSGAPGTMRLGENSGAAYGAESRPPGTPMTGYGDSGGASRFFYVAKTSRSERNAGLDGFEERPGPSNDYGTKKQHPLKPAGEPNIVLPVRNDHPTVKPIQLMRWLLRLVTPPGGLALDPFAGSGSTGCAAALEGIRFVGVELDPDYLEIARARIAWWDEHGEDGFRLCGELDAAARRRARAEDAGQLDLFA